YGIGRGSGLWGDSHASVHADFSWRENFPVRHFDLTVSRAVAASIFSRNICGTSDSEVVSHTEPVHTPAAPIAMHAAIWRPFAIPPAASTGTSRIGLIARMTSGISTMVDTSLQWPPASHPSAMIMSTPA